jgi:hypothetical protein
MDCRHMAWAQLHLRSWAHAQAHCVEQHKLLCGRGHGRAPWLLVVGVDWLAF